MPASARLYVGNLSWGVKAEDLRQMFGAYGRVEDSHVATERDSGRSRGFGFVTMTAESEVHHLF